KIIAGQSGWHRLSVYASVDHPQAQGEYTIEFFEPPGTPQACFSNFPQLNLGESTQGASISSTTDCFGADNVFFSETLSDRYRVSLGTPTLFRINVSAENFDPAIAWYSDDFKLLNATPSISPLSHEFLLPAGQYWLLVGPASNEG